METQILEQKENAVVGRKEIKFSIVYEQKPPTRTDAIQMVSTAAKTKPEFTIIKKMNNVFGFRKLVGMANAYEDEKTIKKYETKNILKRNKYGEKAEPKKEETPAVAAPVTEEKPVEAPKEKAPAEEPKETPTEEKKEGEA